MPYTIGATGLYAFSPGGIDDSAEANAAMIVRAVNNFDSLLAALEQIRDGAYDNAHDPKTAARIAAAAIAKAKGS